MAREKNTKAIPKYNEELKEKGFICNEDIFGTHQKVALIDLDGYKYYASVNQLQTNSEKLRVADKSNPYSMDNIKLFTSRKFPDMLILDGQEYISNKHLIDAKCSIHGFIKTKWNMIQSSQGNSTICWHCGNERRIVSTTISPDIILSRFKEIHGNKYDYSKSEIINTKTKIEIICPLHGSYMQNPNNHLLGKGCPSCGVELAGMKKRHTQESAMNKLIEVHGDKYKYPDFKYEMNKKKITCVCEKHGEFKSTHDNLTQGYGCPKCAMENRQHNGGGWTLAEWEKQGLSSVNFSMFKTYIIKCWDDSGELFYKCGVTFKNIEDRFYGNVQMPYNWCIIDIKLFDNAENAWMLEKKIHSDNKKFHYKPKIKFSGSTKECFSVPLSFNQII